MFIVTLKEKLEGYIRSIELNGEPPLINTTHWVVLSTEAGITGRKSDYLLLPEDISRFITEEIGLNIRNPAVKKFCHLIIEKNGEVPRIRVQYDFEPSPVFWRGKQ